MSEAAQILLAAVIAGLAGVVAFVLWDRVRAARVRAEAREVLDTLRALGREPGESVEDRLEKLERDVSRLKGISAAEKGNILALIDEAAAEYYLELQRYDVALDRAERALQTNPNSVAALDLKSGCLAQLSRVRPEQKARLLELALEAIDRAISLDAKEASLFVARGWILDEMERYAEAIEAYEQAFRLDPTLIESIYNKACALAKMGDPKGALRTLESLVSSKERERVLDWAENDPDLTETLGNDPSFSAEFHRLLRR